MKGMSEQYFLQTVSKRGMTMDPGKGSTSQHFRGPNSDTRELGPFTCTYKGLLHALQPMGMWEYHMASLPAGIIGFPLG